jgi:PKD repeat protein
MIWKTTLAFLVTLLSLGNAFAQFTADQPDLRSCGGWNCTSNNFTLNQVYLTLEDVNGNELNISSCTIGQTETAYVVLNYTSNANNTINSARLFADLVIDGTTIGINEFLGSVAPATAGSQTKRIYGPFSWTCGDELRLEDILVVWRTGGNNDISNKYDCSSYNKSQCEFGENTFVAAPLAVQFDYTVCRSNGTTTVNYTSTTNGGKAPFQFSWDFTTNGTVNSTEANPTFTTTSTANFTTTLTVIDSQGTTNTRVIEIINPAELDIQSAITNIGCTENGTGAIDLTVTGGTGDYSFSWTGPNNYSSSNKDLTDLTEGTYTVSVKDEFGCEKSLEVIIEKPETPGRPEVAATTQPTCEESTGSFSITAVNGLEYSFNGGTFGSITSWDELTPGDYSVIARNENGCESSVLTITINDQPTTPAAEISNDNGLDLSCLIPTTTLTASGGVSYSWSNGSTEVGTSAALEVSEAGTYTVTVTGENGCTATASETVTLDDTLPTAAIANEGLDLSCNITALTLTASGGVEYSWYNGSTEVGTSAALEVTEAGTYTVTVTGENGCTATASETVTLDDTLPSAAIANEGLELSCKSHLFLLPLQVEFHTPGLMDQLK